MTRVPIKQYLSGSQVVEPNMDKIGGDLTIVATEDSRRHASPFKAREKGNGGR